MVGHHIHPSIQQPRCGIGIFAIPFISLLFPKIIIHRNNAD